MYRIRMDDPLVPEDEARLKELLIQKLSGLNVDPETGQIDILQVLDRLSETEVEDLQLKLSDRSDDQVPDADAAEIDGAISELAERLGEILIGHNSRPRNAGEPGQTSDSEDDAAYPGAVFVPTAELHSFELAEDQVLLLWEEGYLAVPIAEVVKRDLRISGGYPGSRTECFYSVQHALGENPQDRPPEEQVRINRMDRLEQALSERYAYLGAFSLEEALQRHFSSDLVTQFLADKSEAEHARIAGWVAYVRRQKNLVNPAGFLRTKIESRETPPNSDVEFRNSNLEIGNPTPRPESSPGSAEGSQIPNSQSEIPNPKSPIPDLDVPNSETSSRDLWDAALDELQLQMPRSTFDTWLKNTYIARIEEDRFTLACANPYAKDWLEERLDPKISKTLAGILGHPVTVEYEIASAAGSQGDDLDEDDNEA
ncbi:MAG: DnaA N-terminal domain-containing protein [Dehalococcoidia bacterium]